MNLTVVSPTVGGYLSAYADGTTRPNVSNLDFAKGQTVPNLAVVPVGTDGKIQLFNGSAGTLNLLADVAGYYLAGSAKAAGTYVPVTPERAFDTRDAGSSPIAANQYQNVYATPSGQVPAFGVAALVMNVTVTAPPASGFLTAYPDGLVRPNASNLDFAASRTSANLVVAPVASDGQLRLYNGSSQGVNVTVDIAGYFVKALPPPRLTWAHGTSPDPIRGRPLSLSCVTSTFCVAVDASGAALTYTASGWNAPVQVTGGNPQMKTVSCATTTFCVGIDLIGQSRTFNGTTWSAPLKIGDQLATLRSISCVTTTFCLAVGASGNSAIYDGSTWSAPVKADSQGGLTAVSCTSTTSCITISTSGRASKFNGSTWSAAVQIDSNSRYLDSLSCAGTLCVAADAGGYTISGNIVTNLWNAPVKVNPARGSQSVSCSSATSCVLIDIDGNARTSTNGTNWSAATAVMSTTNQNDQVWLSCVTGFSGALDLDGKASTYNGTVWAAAIFVDAANSITDVSCPSVSFCLAIDAAGQTLTYDGTTWSAPTTIESADNGLHSVSCVSATFCMALDLAGNALRYNGASWTSVTIDNLQPNVLSAVSCASATFCVAVDLIGRSIRFNGTSWGVPLQADHTGSGLTAVSCASSTFCMATDYTGNAIRYNGTTWSSPTALVRNGLTDVSCTSPTFCIAVGYADRVAQYNGSAWSLYTTVDYGPDYGLKLSCASPTLCVATNSNAMEFNGSEWSAPVALEPPLIATEPACAATTCVVFDNHNEFFKGTI